MGLVDQENQQQVGQEINQRQQNMQPQIPGMGSLPTENPQQEQQAQTIPGGGEADINSMLTPNTFTPDRINLG